MLSQLAAKSHPINIKNLILLIKSNRQIPNMVIETSTALDTNMNINYNNTSIRHEKSVTKTRC